MTAPKPRRLRPWIDLADPDAQELVWLASLTGLQLADPPTRQRLLSSLGPQAMVELEPLAMKARWKVALGNPEVGPEWILQVDWTQVCQPGVFPAQICTVMVPAVLDDLGFARRALRQFATLVLPVGHPLADRWPHAMWWSTLVDAIGTDLAWQWNHANDGTPPSQGAVQAGLVDAEQEGWLRGARQVWDVVMGSAALVDSVPWMVADLLVKHQWSGLWPELTSTCLLMAAHVTPVGVSGWLAAQCHQAGVECGDDLVEWAIAAAAPAGRVADAFTLIVDAHEPIRKLGISAAAAYRAGLGR